MSRSSLKCREKLLEPLFAVFLALLVLFSVSAPTWALPEPEIRDLMRQFPEFRSVEQELKALWSSLPSELKTGLIEEQREWVERGRDRQARDLMAEGAEFVEAYTEVTRKRLQELEALLNSEQPGVVAEQAPEPETPLGPPTRGHIQISGPSGVEIFLDGRSVGRTVDDESGLFLADVSGGYHDIRAAPALPNFSPVEKRVRVFPGLVIQVKLEFREAEPKVENITRTESILFTSESGVVIFSSAPLGAEVYLDGKIIGVTDLKAVDVPTGKHQATFSRGEEKLEAEFDLATDQVLILSADFIKGRVSLLPPK